MSAAVPASCIAEKLRLGAVPPRSIVSAFRSFLHVSHPTQQSEVTVRLAGNTGGFTPSKLFCDSDGRVLNGAVPFEVLGRNVL